MKLRLLIDTSVWLDLAKDHRQLPIIDALSELANGGELDLILPRAIIDEFQRNKARAIADSKRSLSGHFRLVREAVVQFAPEGEERDMALRQLGEVDHRIAVGGEPINDAIEQIENLFATYPIIELTDVVKVRAAERALAKLAPFHRQRNGMVDAILIETYIDALDDRTADEGICAFVTHNVQDFSERGADTRLPHPHLASLFDGSSSRYATNLAALLNEFVSHLIEEVRFEREFSMEPRKLSELLEVEGKLTRQVWYNRKWNIIARVESGEEKLVSREVWDAATPEERRGMIVDNIWEAMLTAMKRAEEQYPGELGPWSDFEWGMLNGKLSALRWVLGDEWDMLDT